MAGAAPAQSKRHHSSRSRFSNVAPEATVTIVGVPASMRPRIVVSRMS